MRKWWKLALVVAVLVMLPGQNEYQTLAIRPQAPRIREASVEVEPNQVPVKITQVRAPGLTARAVVVLDVASGTVMYQKNAEMSLMPASITKVMTALVALEAYKLDEVLTVCKKNESES